MSRFQAHIADTKTLYCFLACSAMCAWNRDIQRQLVVHQADAQCRVVAGDMQLSFMTDTSHCDEMCGLGKQGRLSLEETIHGKMHDDTEEMSEIILTEDGWHLKAAMDTEAICIDQPRERNPQCR